MQLGETCRLCTEPLLRSAPRVGHRGRPLHGFSFFFPGCRPFREGSLEVTVKSLSDGPRPLIDVEAAQVAAEHRGSHD